MWQFFLSLSDEKAIKKCLLDKTIYFFNNKVYKV